MRGAKAVEARTEGLRVLRSNLLVAVADLDHPVVVVTSANRGEGKTATCAGLARSLAVAGRRVVVVDLDLRDPGLHERFGVDNQVGVVDVLTTGHPLAEAMQLVEPPQAGRTDRQGFWFLASGPSVDNPTELLGSPATAELLDTLAAQADIVLLDAAPVLPVADTLVVARLATGALLVVEAGRTPAPDAQAARAALERSGVLVLGVVLNKLDAREVRLGYGGGGLRDPLGEVHEVDGAGPTGALRWPAWADPPA